MNLIFISLANRGENVSTFSHHIKSDSIMTLKQWRLTKMNTIKFLVVFFSLGYSIYFGSILFDALYQIQNNNLQTYSELLKQ
tara:strand:- start:739 stop:984 length:246 start_codon:yes stop_codon:yes gene_type:complete